MQKTSLSAPSWCPLGVLPVELWAEIFALSLSEDQFVTPNASNPPILLGRVCTEWRNIAYNTPDLWKTLALTSSDNVDHQSSVAGIETWLESSYTYPLSISLSIPQRSNAQLHKIVNRLLRTAQRWRHLKIDVENDTLDQILSTPMPSLYSIQLDCFNPLKKITISPFHLPSLRTISFFDPVCIDSRYILPWSQITDISSVGLANTETHMHRLRASPNLNSYDMTLFFADSPAMQEPFPLAGLKRLRIVAWVPDAIGSMLDNLVLPMLEELIIEVAQQICPCEPPPFPLEAFRSLVERSECLFQRLNVKNLRLPSELTCEFQNAHPSLKISVQ
ncbi:hypothetical protein CPB83DRAFT_248894 [Crepidotus variabilis]|uniref:F-box domain-containing protein n=1 Tax=Crepidotus variabilis TaxID=179855 RepID=A0A9P6JRG3_9AGAR|nr:hypothetical protein CPB83DRAFT_248894 [Crepidotus variabilis]